MQMRYRAKIDWWIGLSLLLALLVPLAMGVLTRSWPMCVLFGFTCTLIFGFCFPQSYETAATELILRASIRKIRIPYEEMTTVRMSTDSRSALALSLERILIEYQSGAVMIAPENREAFFADIQKHAPQLSKRGVDLVLSLA